MNNNFTLIPTNIINTLAVTEIMHCNEITFLYGLKLSKSEAYELVNTRTTSLNSNGRVEFAGGIINKLIMEFCDSPFISQYNYSSTLNDLIEIFYYYKNETLDEISDDELIKLMRKYFDESCKGSIDLLQNRELDSLARNIRYGLDNYNPISYDTEKYFIKDDDDDYE